MKRTHRSRSQQKRLASGDAVCGGDGIGYEAKEAQQRVEALEEGRPGHKLVMIVTQLYVEDERVNEQRDDVYCGARLAIYTLAAVT